MSEVVKEVFSLPPSLTPSLPPSPSLSLCVCVQNFPQDTMKIGTILSGWLYAFEMPKHVVMSTCQPQSSNRVPRNEPGRKLLSPGDQDGPIVKMQPLARKL